MNDFNAITTAHFRSGLGCDELHVQTRTHVHCKFCPDFNLCATI